MAELQRQVIIISDNHALPIFDKPTTAGNSSAVGGTVGVAEEVEKASWRHQARDGLSRWTCCYEAEAR